MIEQNPHRFTRIHFVRSLARSLGSINIHVSFGNVAYGGFSLPLSDSLTWTHKASKQTNKQTIIWNHFEKLHLQSSIGFVCAHQTTPHHTHTKLNCLIICKCHLWNSSFSLLFLFDRFSNNCFHHSKCVW